MLDNFYAASSQEESGFIEDAMSGLGAGVINTAELGALGVAALAEEESELAARDKIQAAADYLRPEGGDKDSYTYKIASGVGSVVGTLGAAGVTALAMSPFGAGASGIAGLLAAGAVGVGAGAGKPVNVHVPQALLKKNVISLLCAVAQSVHSKYYLWGEY